MSTELLDLPFFQVLADCSWYCWSITAFRYNDIAPVGVHKCLIAGLANFVSSFWLSDDLGPSVKEDICSTVSFG